MHHDILHVLIDYAELFNPRPTKWDAVNYCIGYYGSVTNDHIQVIEYLVRQGDLLP